MVEIFARVHDAARVLTIKSGGIVRLDSGSPPLWQMLNAPTERAHMAVAVARREAAFALVYEACEQKVETTFWKIIQQLRVASS